MNKVIISKSELQHYGVLGMKWGIRRNQNKDGIKRYYRVSDKTEILRKKPMYVTGSARDIVGYSNMLQELRGTKEFRILEFEGDLRIANTKDAKAIFENLKSTNPKFKSFLDSPYVDTKRSWDRNKYSDYSSSLADRNRKHKIFYSAIKKAGFDGLVDYNDSNVMEDPLIIIDVNKLHRLKTRKQVTSSKDKK